MMSEGAAATILCLLSMACVQGPKVADFRPGQQPEGVGAELRVGYRTLRGELLSIDDQSLLLRQESRILRVFYVAIDSGVFDQMSDDTRIKGRAPDRDAREQLRQVSRFPQDLSDELLGALLEAYNQQEVEEIAEVLE